MASFELIYNYASHWIWLLPRINALHCRYRWQWFTHWILSERRGVRTPLWAVNVKDVRVNLARDCWFESHRPTTCSTPLIYRSKDRITLGKVKFHHSFREKYIKKIKITIYLVSDCFLISKQSMSNISINNFLMKRPIYF